MKPHLNMKINWLNLEASLGPTERAIAIERQHIELLWELVSKPIKFPNRRREDRELPTRAA